jgi:hypothetical protein
MVPGPKIRLRRRSTKASTLMLSLDSPRWAQFDHAYGTAADIPPLLRDLQSLPTSGGDKEPWFSLWSALAHQGDVFSASFAAVPHVIRAFSIAPERASHDFVGFPAWVEICRQRKKTAIPADLSDAYFAALKQLPALIAAAATRDWDEDFLVSSLSAIAAAKGYAGVAEAVLELTPAVAEEFLRSSYNR